MKNRLKELQKWKSNSSGFFELVSIFDECLKSLRFVRI